MWRKALSEIHLWRHWRRRLFRLFRWLTWDRRNPLRRQTFQLGRIEYPYFLHPYNQTWTNERAVEISVARRFLELSSPSSTLEIGNVLSHYYRLDHTVVDKYEDCRFRPVINVDLLQFDPGRQFESIVSVSTFEHIGWDEQPRDETRVTAAFQKLQSLLAPGGKALVTIPLGYNHYLDHRLSQVLADSAEIHCMKRISDDNRWVEADLDEALRCKYGTPFDFANALAFIYLKGD